MVETLTRTSALGAAEVGESVARPLRVSIVIPAYNEEHSLGTLLAEVTDHLAADASGRDYEVIVVDDGSGDRTAEIAAGAPGTKLIRHRFNKGYGAALKTGIRQASGDVVVTMDADGQHHPSDIPALLDALGDYDMVAGARTERRSSPLWRRPGKRLLGWLANYLAEQRIPDLNCGLRVVKKDVVTKYLHLCPNGFSFSTTIQLALLCAGYRVKYLPITASKRDPLSKSAVTVRAGLDTLLLTVRIISLFGPLKLFLPMSVACMIGGVLWASRYLLLGRGLSVSALLLILTSILLFFFGLLADQIAALRKERYE